MQPYLKNRKESNMEKVTKTNSKRPRTATSMATAATTSTIAMPNAPITEGATSSTNEDIETSTSIDPSITNMELAALFTLNETAASTNVNSEDLEASNQEMEVDSDNSITDLYPNTPPANFREVAINTLASLKAENIALSEQIVYMSTLIVGRPLQHRLLYYQQ